MTGNLRIQFDNPHTTYYAGQNVTGRVLISTDKPKKIRGITIKFKGEAEVKWSESHRVKDADGKSRTKTTHYSGNEMYCENKYYLIGSGSGEMELPRGEHNYPFQFQIPHTAPSSFEGEYGHIRYTAKAVMDRPWKFDKECKAAFTVVCPLDLNALPQVKEPIEFENSKHFCCLWCKSGPLTVTIRLPVSGYVPGQTIPFEIEIDNASNVLIQPINCVLRKEVTWHVRSPRHKTKVTKVKLADLAVDDEVNPHETKSFSKDIVVPAVPPSNLANCGIIDLEYILKIEAIADGCHNNLTARIPIVLGTIPLLTGPTAYKPKSGVVQPSQPSPDPSAHPIPIPSPAPAPAPPFGGGWNIPPPVAPGTPQPVDPSFAPSAPPLYPELPPPSYEESIFKGNNIRDASDNDHTSGMQDFTPRYPVWTFSQPMGVLGRLM